MSARRDAQRTARGKPHKPSIFYNRYLLQKRCDRLSADEIARLGAIFDDHPELGVVWGMCSGSTSSSAVIETEPAADEAVDQLAQAYQDAGVNLGAAIRSFCSWGTETLAFHLTGRATNGRSEGVNTKLKCLERMAYGFSNRANYTARVLLVCSGHPAPVT